MKTFLKAFLGVIIMAVVLTAGYCAVIIIKARIDTPGIIARAKAGENLKLQLSDFSQWQIDALLKVEDPAFYSHKGVDVKTPGAGITTITQGLVKKLYFKNFKPGFAKVKQTLIAQFALDPMVSKEEQLALFVNIIGLGRCKTQFIDGFYDAAECYYSKKVRGLTKDEYLSLVAMIIAPVNFSLLEHPDANAERVKRIKALLSGEYKPNGLMDIYYGPLDKATQEGLAPVSYFEGVYSSDKKANKKTEAAKIRGYIYYKTDAAKAVLEHAALLKENRILKMEGIAVFEGPKGQKENWQFIDGKVMIIPYGGVDDVFEQALDFFGVDWDKYGLIR